MPLHTTKGGVFELFNFLYFVFIWLSWLAVSELLIYVGRILAQIYETGKVFFINEICMMPLHTTKGGVN